MTIRQKVPEIFADYVRTQESEGVNPIGIKRVTFTMTQAEAIEDLQVFQYILDNAYSGRQYWQNKGVNFLKIYETIRAYINSHDLIYKHEIFSLYHEQLKDIHDGHLALQSYNNSVNFGKKYKAYFTDILLEKRNNQFIVIFSKAPALTAGSILSHQQVEGKTFKTLSPTGKEHFLLGCRSWKNIDKLIIRFNDEDISLPAHPCKASDYRKAEDSIFIENTVEGLNVVTSTRFLEWDDKIANDFYNCGFSLRSKNTIIWNLLGNGGGNSNYPLQFIKGLNEYSNWRIDCAVLNSPAINQAQGASLLDIQNRREWSFWTAEERDLSKGVFMGTLYVLSNDSIASSGEAALNIARSVRNCIIVGQNSGGIGVFGDVLAYQLPYSDIRMIVPYKLFLGGANEGEGFEPDYWVDNTDVQGELISWLKSPYDYQALR